MGTERSQRRDTDPVQAAPQGEMDALLLGRTKELSTFDPDGRNWRGIFISLLVIAAVCSLILTAIIFLSPVQCIQYRSTRLTLDDLTSSKFVPRDYNASWITDKVCPKCWLVNHTSDQIEIAVALYFYHLTGHELVYQDHEEALILFNAKTLTKTVLLSNITFRQNHVQKCTLSADKRYLLLMSNLIQISRTRWQADYKIYDLIKHVSELYRFSRFISNCERMPSFLPFSTQANKIALVEWGPAGNQMVFVYENSLYYIPSVGAKVVHISISTSNTIFIGILNWFYREKVMETDRGLWWLSNGKKLAFMLINESSVNSTDYLWYGGSIYPKVRHIKYPRPGGVLPVASLWISDFRNAPLEIEPPRDHREERFLYLTAVSWVDDNRIIVNWAPRSQTVSWVTLCQFIQSSWNCGKMLEVKAKAKHSWTEFLGPPLPSLDGKSCFVVLPRETTNLDSFRHIAIVPFNSRDKPPFVTNGSYDVIDIVSNDVEGNLFFTRTLEDRPDKKHLFSINTKASSPLAPKCLTCSLEEECGYSDALFSPNAHFYILLCLGPNVPKLEVWSVKDDKPVLILDSYHDIETELTGKSKPFVQNIRIPLHELYRTNIKLMMPTKVDPDEGTKFPLLLFAGDGLGRRSTQVSDRFQIGLPAYFSGSRHYVVALMDGRGSRYHGNRMLHAADWKPWQAQTDDFITVARYLLKTLPFVDASRVGIIGRGFGGFSTIKVLNDFYSPFSCGVAVAPITSWRFADALTSERYLGFPSSPEGQDRYENVEFSNGVYGLSNKNFLLVHGTADQEVPVFHSMLLMKQLAAEGATYRSQIYPDEDHYMKGALGHFYKTLDAFFKQCFRVETEPPTNHILPGFKKSKILIAG